jgi:hypothetical protein
MNIYEKVYGKESLHCNDTLEGIGNVYEDLGELK